MSVATEKYTEIEGYPDVACAATIYQDRNLDLPWDKSAKAIALAAWPGIEFGKSVVILGTNRGDFPVKFIQRWDISPAAEA